MTTSEFLHLVRLLEVDELGEHHFEMVQELAVAQLEWEHERLVSTQSNVVPLRPERA